MTRSLIPALLLTLCAVLIGVLANIGTANLPDWMKRHQPYAWPALVGATLLMLGLRAWEITCERRSKTPESPQPHFDSVLRMRLLDKVLNERVDPRLRQGLRESIRVDLGLTKVPGAVQANLRIYATLESGTEEEKPVSIPIQDIFEQAAGGRLLILGEPGTGKTNLLLELAQSLVAAAKRDDTCPIPIVFSLPRWTMGKRVRTLGEWLEDDLASWYGLSRTAATALVVKDGILPLLDGLDEVAEDRRAACARAIHAYQETRNLGRLVVCCRLAEYAALPKLNLGAAIRVEKLSRADVEHEIARPRMEYVRRALNEDPELRNIIDRPLLLHVLFGAAQVAFTSGSQLLPEPSPRDRLYARYVEYALGREADWSPRKRTARGLLLRRLGWLAREMRRRDQTQFVLEDLDLSWIVRGTVQIEAWFVGSVFGLIDGIVVWLGLGPAFGLAFGLVVWLVFGLFRDAGIIGFRGDVVAVEELGFGGFRRKPGLGFGLVVALIITLVLLLVIGLGVGLLLSILIALCVGILVGLHGVLEPQPISQRSSPNRGTVRSLRYAIMIGLSGCAASALLSTAAPRFLSEHIDLGRDVLALSIAWPALLLSLKKGGLFVVRHCTVRVVLALRGVAPLRYVNFLDESTERLFLIRRGGSYEFFHSTFRDYFAEAHDCAQTPAGRRQEPGFSGLPSSRSSQRLIEFRPC